MGTAIRYLKYEISLIDQEMNVDEVRTRLAEREISLTRIVQGQVVAIDEDRLVHPRSYLARRQSHRATRDREDSEWRHDFDLRTIISR